MENKRDMRRSTNGGGRMSQSKKFKTKQRGLNRAAYDPDYSFKDSKKRRDQMSLLQGNPKYRDDYKFHS